MVRVLWEVSMAELANIEYESLLDETKDIIHQKQYQVLK